MLRLLNRSSDLHVEIVSDARGLEALTPAWIRLLQEAAIDHPFATPEWVRTSWETFGAGHEMLIVVVRSNGFVPGAHGEAGREDDIVAIAPLMLGEAHLCGVPVRRLEFIGNVHTQRSDFIVSRRAPEAYGAIWRALAAERAGWDVLMLSQIPDGSPTLEALPAFASAQGLPAAAWPAAESPYLALQGDYERWFLSLPSKLRTNLRNRMRRLERLGDVRLDVVETEDGLDAALEEGLRLEASGWKGKAGTAILARPERRALYTRFARLAARRGWLRLHFLRLNGRAIAFDYSVRFADKAYVLKPGYDPEYAPLSPSSLLLSMSLRRAFEEGIRELDFLGEMDRWKLDWTGTVRPHHWLYVFSDSAKGRLLHALKFRLAPQLRKNRGYRAAREATVRFGRSLDAFGRALGLGQARGDGR